MATNTTGDRSNTRAVPAAVKVTIQKIKLTGVTSFAADRTDALTADSIGKELDFGQIQALADRITTFYRSQGFVAARAWLPAQRIENGMVERRRMLNETPVGATVV